MKKLFLTALMVLTLAHLVGAQPSAVYQNDGVVGNPPPQVDAITFVNNGLFDIGFNSISVSNGASGGALFLNSQVAPFDFSDVLYFTNRGVMICDTGFTFDNAPPIIGSRKMAASFGNGNIGQISAGSATNSLSTGLVFFSGPGLSFLSGVPVLTIWATNVVNTGLLDVGTDGRISIEGRNLNLSHGTMHVEGFDELNISSTIGTIGVMNQYYGLDRQTNGVNRGSLSTNFVISPLNKVTNVAGFSTYSVVVPFPSAVAFANVKSPNASNNCVQVVFINTNLLNVSTDVRFIPGSPDFDTPIIQWQSTVTNDLGGLAQTVSTNSLYLQDTFGSNPTNTIVTNSTSLSGIPQLAPYNYSFSRSFPAFPLLPPGNTSFDPALFAKAFPETNAYSAYGVDVTPVTASPDPTLPDSTVTNVPGRIELNALNSLDLTRATVTGANYLKLNSSNHFVGSDGAQIDAPYMELNLGSTNGLLSVSNVVPPYVPRFTGPIDMWSGRWTNIDAKGITNTYHVLIVNAQIAPTAQPQVVNCTLSAPNVVISDALNVQKTLLVNAVNLTITSNGSNAPTPYGQLNLNSSDILWTPIFPILQSVTNFGLLAAPNSAYFEVLHESPYYPSNSVAPYTAFVNHGLVSTAADIIWANYFENTGGGLIISNYSGISTTTNQSALIYSSVGTVMVKAAAALMLNGAMVALGGDMSITSDTLTITNHILYTSGALTLTVNNTLTDGGGASSNFWTVGDGMNLTVKPASGDLVGTTISNSAPPSVEVDNIWAGADLGASTAGFVNNAALGHLILDGGDNASQFYFGGPDNSQNYALYVGLLELRDGATNRTVINGIEAFTTFDMAPNMTIYYGDAVIAGGLDISDKLNGASGGHLVWVPSYMGPFR